MKKYILFILFAFFASLTGAQEYTPYGVKVAYIYKFASYIQWENEGAIDTFRIGIFDSDASLLSELTTLTTTKTLKSKPIELVKFSDIDSIKNVQLFYVSNHFVPKAEDIFKKIQGRNILLVTDNCSKKQFVMINFSLSDDIKQSISFEINTKTITDNNLTILPELLLLGGSEIDKRKLFSDIQDSLKRERVQVQQQQILLEKQQTELVEQNAKLVEQQKLIDDQNKSIIVQQQRIEEQKKNLGELSMAVIKQHNILQDKLALLKQAEEFLKLQDEKVKLQEENIEQHAKTLKEQTEKIDIQQNILKEQEENLSLKTTTIRKQENTIYFIVLILLLVIILSGYIYRNYKQKKQINKELEHRNQAIVRQSNKIQKQKEEIQAQAKELIVKNEKLLELDQFKKGMTSMIVHDMKNSLNAIINAPERYSKDEKLLINKQYGQQMLNMVLNILDVNKYEETKMNVNFQSISLHEISSKAIEQVLFLSSQKSISIVNKINKNIAIRAEAEILERVFVNLLTNAIKYSKPKSDILIEVENITDQNFSRIKITDFGVGIPNDKRHLVFQKFGQVEARSSGGVRSAGIGLTFCKMAIEAHGGEIDFVSEPEKGATFWFTLQNSSKIDILPEKETKTKTKVVAAEIHLSEQDKEYLLPYINELKKHKIYEISSLNQIIEQVEDKSEPIKCWKKYLREVIDNFDKENFTSIIQ